MANALNLPRRRPQRTAISSPAWCYERRLLAIPHCSARLRHPATTLALVSAPPGAWAAYPDEVRQDHPLAHWRFEDAAAAAADQNAVRPAQSETGDHTAEYRGAVAATAGVPGIGGEAAAFQTPGRRRIPPHPALDGNVVSVEFWFSSTQEFSDRYWPGSGTFLSKATASNASSDWVIIAGSGAPKIPAG